jgi:hypothetical protein
LKLAGSWGGETEVKSYPGEDHNLLLRDNSSWADITAFLARLVESSIGTVQTGRWGDQEQGRHQRHFSPTNLGKSGAGDRPGDATQASAEEKLAWASALRGFETSTG